MSLLQRCGGILAHSSWQNCCNSATFSLFKVMPQHLNRIQVRTWLGHSKVFILFFFSHSEVDLLVCFGSLSCCRTQGSLQLEVTNRWPDIVLQDFLVDSRIHGSIYHSKSSRSWSSKTAPDHHTTTTIFYCWYDVLFLNAVLLLRQM